MPELPEVETLRRALLPLTRGKKLERLAFLRPDLRFPIPVQHLEGKMCGTVIREISRTGKYILLHNDKGAMLWHLGMSGRVVQRATLEPEEKHTHAVFHFAPDTFLHFIDPRRFGCILWVPQDEGHPLLNHLGPDPFSDEANAAHFKERARTCKGPVKGFLMNATRIAGIGNIYACEALFEAGIHPMKRANKLSKPQWEKLLTAVRNVLKKSIQAGGTTLRDFFNTDGNPGYFAIELSVYGKEGEPCPRCHAPISRTIHTARSTFFCKSCQKR
ncbi:MAG: bifunctional DNA-formamidopyrimidine glycosylase/DNA-(apurinic or apyrimidinic site) lyase [Nitrospinaceae bacterium]|nr:bifunctional DNA-formamidopyrimidine glycosylase/DNA-(apurinic or apyrimidinic site) lyase [Nitrospinaceae bacterium]NIR53800.1 bifunctional DNA-formamidopyrimidine glycosylase/DNA-(apurinic or apyrimidinic site) lyase [Nitrospinaceae bacterium]NIS84210.1 bifunctional DNA-formamidopyrimidine glycosylase/DNA-(apurinic or apyrimidinic site) lyase [Nitrospinaceae bacterium]NIT81016.1 bifunctional DNA-formamidopyrimidine glycosylase/DNA-(apurinic or apyrimidinic site) lyase [Nitrospinaceae bacter